MNAILKEIAAALDGFDLVCSTQVIKNEVRQGLTLGDVAKTYALAIRAAENGADKPDWMEINSVITARFGKKGLDQIKKIAWRSLGVSV